MVAAIYRRLAAWATPAAAAWGLALWLLVPVVLATAAALRPAWQPFAAWALAALLLGYWLRSLATIRAASRKLRDQPRGWAYPPEVPKRYRTR